MRVNSSPSSLIGPVASYHVSAQLLLLEHPQKPRADVPTGALQEGLLLREPLGTGGCPGGPGSPRDRAAVARQLPREPGPAPLPAGLPAEGPAFLQLMLHGEVLISSSNGLYFCYCSPNGLEEARGHAGERWQQRLRLGRGAGSVLHVPPLPPIQGCSKKGREKTEAVRVMKQRGQNPLPERLKKLSGFWFDFQSKLKYFQW